MKEIIKKEFVEHIEISKKIKNLLLEVIEEAAVLCIEALKENKKIILFGNGGSAGDAQHLAAELVGRYKKERKGYPAIALTTDSSAITAIGNDYGFENIFSRQIEALAQEGDVIIGISTSGKSTNVLKGLELAKKMKCKTIMLTGKKKVSKKVVDLNISVPSINTPRIQEMHITIGQIICGLIEKSLTEKSK
tara:strand:+ start:277 stop:852 length:576 start_codon:yes stop_codon:yes gene_type:complete